MPWLLINNEWRFRKRKKESQMEIVKKNFRSLIEKHGNLISRKES